MARPSKRTASLAEGVESNSGAPAALKAMEGHELRSREEKDKAYTIWLDAKEKFVDGDDVAMRALHKAHEEYTECLEIWHNASKSLLSLDKGVSLERREGEKISVAEAKEHFKQFVLSIDLAIEAYIVQISQTAALCESGEQFHIAHSDAIRSAKAGAIEAAIRDGKLPNWLIE